MTGTSTARGDGPPRARHGAPVKADAREAARRFFTSGGQCPGNLMWEPEPEHSAG